MFVRDCEALKIPSGLWSVQYIYKGLSRWLSHWVKIFRDPDKHDFKS